MLILIEIRVIKHKKKMIDKLLKLRQDTEDILQTKKFKHGGIPGLPG